MASQSNALYATPRRRLAEAARLIGSGVARRDIETSISGYAVFRHATLCSEKKRSLPREAFQQRLLTDASAYDAVTFRRKTLS